MYRDIRGAMVKFPYVADPHLTLAKAEIYMKECNIRHLPIIDQDQIVGLVSERDLLRYKGQEDYDWMTLDELIEHKPFVVDQSEPLANVLNIMISSKYGSALVVNKEQQLVGIFTTTDALRLLENYVSGDPQFKPDPNKVIHLKDVVGWN